MFADCFLTVALRLEAGQSRKLAVSGGYGALACGTCHRLVMDAVSFFTVELILGDMQQHESVVLPTGA